MTGILKNRVKKLKPLYLGTLWARHYLRVISRYSDRHGNVAMFHTGRSGSSVLANMIGQHPDFKWDREVIASVQKKKYSELVMTSNLFKIIEIRKARQRCKYYGFETKALKDYHLNQNWFNMDLTEYVKTLRNMDFKYFIVLKRRNYLRRAVSQNVGFHLKKWHATEEVTSPTKVSLDLHNFRLGYGSKPLLESFQEMDNYFEELDNLLHDEHKINLTYEKDILPDPNIAYRKICEFLEIPVLQPQIRYKRSNPFPLSDMILNFGEVVDYLRGTQYEWMIED
jgi:hypothetical protein